MEIPPNDDDLLTEDIFNDAPTTAATSENASADQNGEEPGDDQQPAAKIRKRLDIPRLNEDRLCSEHGIRSLPALFKDVKFRGQGHEASNLRILLKQYEYWGNQLFPKYCFEDFVDKVEDLGSKAAVKNCIRGMRMGDKEAVHETAADELIGSENEEAAFGAMAAETNGYDSPVDNHREQTAIEPQSITEELRAKIQRNRDIAMQRRAAREALASQQEMNSQESIQGDDGDHPHVEFESDKSQTNGTDNTIATDDVQDSQSSLYTAAKETESSACLTTTNTNTQSASPMQLEGNTADLSSVFSNDGVPQENNGDSNGMDIAARESSREVNAMLTTHAQGAGNNRKHDECDDGGNDGFIGEEQIGTSKEDKVTETSEGHGAELVADTLVLDDDTSSSDDLIIDEGNGAEQTSSIAIDCEHDSL